MIILSHIINNLKGGDYIKIIFFDIDGTLRDELYGVPYSAIKAINMSRKNGYYVCLCTGRNKSLISDDILNIDVDGIIAGGGSYIEFNNMAIRKMFFSKYRIEKVNKYIDSIDKDISITFESEDKIFMNKGAVSLLNSLNSSKFEDLSKSEKNEILSNEKIVYEDNLKDLDFNKYLINKICLWSTDTEFETISELLGNDNFQLVQNFRFDSKNNYYEIVQKGCSKGDAINELCKHLNIDLKDTIGFGDGKNDIDMFKVVGISICVKNSDKDLFEYVDSICEEAMNDGIYLELKRRKII